MSERKKTTKPVKTSTSRVEKRELTEADLERVAGGDNFGNIV